MNIVTVYGLHNRGTLVRFPGEKCNSANRPYRLWGPPSLFCGHWWFLLQKRRPQHEVAIHLHPVLMLWIHGITLHSPHNLMTRKGTIFRLFATRVSQLKIWHFWVIGIERNVCRCTFNRYSVITQFAKLAAGEQFVVVALVKNYGTSKPLRASPEKSRILSCDTVVAKGRFILRKKDNGYIMGNDAFVT